MPDKSYKPANGNSAITLMESSIKHHNAESRTFAFLEWKNKNVTLKEADVTM